MTRERHRNLRALFVVIALSLAAVCAVTLMMSAAYGKAPAKRYKMSAGMAQRITQEKALYAYLADENASTYGAYNCERWNPYGVHCIAYVTFTDGKRCEWLVNVTNSRKNYVRAKEFPPTCRKEQP